MLRMGRVKSRTCCVLTAACQLQATVGAREDKRHDDVIKYDRNTMMAFKEVRPARGVVPSVGLVLTVLPLRAAMHGDAAGAREREPIASRTWRGEVAGRAVRACKPLPMA